MLLMALSVIFPSVMVMAMITDLRSFQIPNYLPLALVLVYPVAAFSAGLSWPPILWAFSLAGLVLVAAVIMFVMGIMGGGDGKLLAAAVLWTGQERLMEFLFITALAGGVLALVLLLFRRLPLATALDRFPAMRQLHAKKQDVPYAVAIGTSGLIVYPYLPIFAA